MSRVLRLSRNRAGRDFIVGDIHGHFSLLAAKLREIGFDAAAGDRLISVGDLVDRGPESAAALQWLALPWFFAVAGNHEQMAIDWADGIAQAWWYEATGGAWNIQSLPSERMKRAAVFRELPLAIELETEAGIVGIVHANVHGDSWADFVQALDDDPSGYVAEVAQWSRDRIGRHWNEMETPPVAGVRAVVVGHTPIDEPVWCGNVLHIDTGGWLDRGHFTVLLADTLEPVVGAMA